MRNTHIYSGLLLGAVSLWCLLWFIPRNTAPAQSELDISPATVPSISIGTVLVLALVMAWQAWRAGPEKSSSMDDEFGTEATGINGAVMVNTLLWVVAAIVSWLIMEYLAFEPAMALFLLVTMLFVGVRSWLTIGLTAVITPIVLSQTAYLFFDTQMPAIWR